MLYNKESILLTHCGRQDCQDMHSYGPIAHPVYVIHYVIKGAGYLEYNRKKYYICAGESFLILPYVIVHYYPDPQDPWEYTWVNFTGQLADKILGCCNMSLQQPICPAIPPNKILPFYDRLNDLDIYHHNKTEACGILLALLGFYADTFPTAATVSRDKTDNRLSNAILQIEANYHYPAFNIEVLCNMLHCNRVTLHRLFQDGLKCSPGQYLLNYRIRQACTMLKKGTLIKTTALSCGFNDQFYFSKIFKQKIGVTPSEYIDKNQ